MTLKEYLYLSRCLESIERETSSSIRAGTTRSPKKFPGNEKRTKIGPHTRSNFRSKIRLLWRVFDASGVQSRLGKRSDWLIVTLSVVLSSFFSPFPLEVRASRKVHFRYIRFSIPTIFRFSRIPRSSCLSPRGETLHRLVWLRNWEYVHTYTEG